MNLLPFTAALLTLAVTSAAPALEVPGLDYYLPAAADYDPAIPTPEKALGFQIGDWHLHHHELVDYLKQLASHSDRVTLTEYARSHGRRPLIYLTITTPTNHAQIDTLRQAHLDRVLHPEKETDLTTAPLIVWMGYGIHGNEPSATNASVLLAYHLAAARHPDTLTMLENTIVLLEPCLNPDGFERFADWTNSHRGQFPSAHRADREHQEGWPSGRSNYYWFDLNRDWLPAVHPESQGRLQVFHHWQPNIVTDYHEMGNVNRSYFFQPGIPGHGTPPDAGPLNQRADAEKSPRHHAAKRSTSMGTLYYTGETLRRFLHRQGLDLSGPQRLDRNPV
jgi:hypothetical protein